MIVNQKLLLQVQPIKDMLPEKVQHNGVSHGLSEIGYDIRIKQDVEFWPLLPRGRVRVSDHDAYEEYHDGNFVLASAIEEFDMPPGLSGVVHDKSSWARQGLSVFNTVIEPGWKGFLTLELVYHGCDRLHIPAGSGIAQVVFHSLAQPAKYEGKYQNQEDRPVEAIFTK